MHAEPQTALTIDELLDLKDQLIAKRDLAIGEYADPSVIKELEIEISYIQLDIDKLS